MAVHNETLGAAIAICGVGGGGGGSSAVTGVKGASESRYRTGDVNITKANIGLGEVDNTSDLNKPISTATQAALDAKQDTLTFDPIPMSGSNNPVTSDGVYRSLVNNLDDILPSILNSANYAQLMKLWFSINGAAPLTDFNDLCEKWYTITRTGWTGGTRFYHATTSMASEGTKVGDNADMVAVPSTNDTAGRDDYQDVPLFHCLDCNWVLDEDGKPHITAIEGVCGNFERTNPEKLVGVIQMAGWQKYIDEVEQYPNYLASAERSSVTKNGLTFTVANDNSIIVDGTATALTYYPLTVDNALIDTLYALRGQSVYMSGNAANGSTTNHYTSIKFGRSGGYSYITDTGNGSTANMPSDDEAYTNIEVFIRINQGTTLDNAVFKPSLRSADVLNACVFYMYTDDTSAEGYAPLPEAVNPDDTVRSWIVHGKYLSGDDYGCYSGARPWAYNASHNTARTNYHTKWGNQYGGKTSADDAFLKLMFFLKYGSLTADDLLQGCVSYNYQYPVAAAETGVERVILTASQANNIKIGSTVMVGNPTAFSAGTTLNIDRNQAGMRAKVDRKKVTRKETLSSGNVAVYIDNGGVAFDTTSNTLQANKTVGPASVLSINDAIGGAASSLTVNIKPVQSGSGDPSPDNARPISGWTEAKVTRCGKNILPPINGSSTTGGVTFTLGNDGSVAVTGTPSSNDVYSSTTPWFTLEPGTYIVSTGIDTNDTMFRLRIGKKVDGSSQLVDHAIGNVPKTITVSERGQYQCFCRIQNKNGVPIDVTYKPMIRLESDNSNTYEPYQAATEYSITFPSEADTVYGGTLDVANGTLTVDTVMRTLNGTENWYASASAATRYYTRVENALGANAVLCTNMYRVNANSTETGTCYIDGNKSFQVNPGMSSVSEFKSFLQSNNLQLVYKIASPVTYQLTAQEVTLLTGSNTVFADCGDVTTQYAANIPAPTYVSTSPWFTGTCDNVRGRDGSPADPSNGTEPYILQGIECALGGYEVFSDTIIKYYKDVSGKYHLTYYICRDASKYSTGITTDYGLVDYEVDCPASNSWQYISEHGRDEYFPEACFPHLIGCTSSQRTKDGMYILAASESAYEYLSLGPLSYGVGRGGLSIVHADSGLGNGYWYILARISATGNRGIYNGGEG